MPTDTLDPIVQTESKIAVPESSSAIVRNLYNAVAEVPNPSSTHPSNGLSFGNLTLKLEERLKVLATEWVQSNSPTALRALTADINRTVNRLTRDYTVSLKPHIIDPDTHIALPFDSWEYLEKSNNNLKFHERERVVHQRKQAYGEKAAHDFLAAMDEAIRSHLGATPGGRSLVEAFSPNRDQGIVF